MKTIGVIPARFGATRFPGKPLAKILGKPMIQWVIEGARQSQLLSEVIVATDDVRISDACAVIQCRSLLTRSDLPSGTDRIYHATQQLDADLIINIQGDEPLVQGKTIDQLIQPFTQDQNLQMGTLAQKISTEEFANPNVVKVIIDQNSDAIYFSRFGIPYSRSEFSASNPCVMKHVGMYAYRREFLGKFCSTLPAAIEQAEALEQLRALWMGTKIRVVSTQEASIGVDAPEDIAKVETVLKSRLS